MKYMRYTCMNLWDAAASRCWTWEQDLLRERISTVYICQKCAWERISSRYSSLQVHRLLTLNMCEIFCFNEHQAKLWPCCESHTSAIGLNSGKVSCSATLVQTQIASRRSDGWLWNVAQMSAIRHRMNPPTTNSSRFFQSSLGNIPTSNRCHVPPQAESVMS